MKRRMWFALLMFAAILLLLFAAFALQVNDWSRDFSQNRAATDVDAENTALRPIQAQVEPAEIPRIIEETVRELRGWKVVSRTDSGAGIDVCLTRTSRLFHFVDDVTVHIEPRVDGCVVNATSQSRVGKGDLGQNPRNITELFSAIRERLPAGQ